MKRVLFQLMVLCCIVGGDGVVGSASKISGLSSVNPNLLNLDHDWVEKLTNLTGWWKNDDRAQQLNQQLMTRPEDPAVYAEISQNAYELLGLDRDKLMQVAYREAKRLLTVAYTQLQNKAIEQWRLERWAAQSILDQQYAKNMAKAIGAARDVIDRELDLVHPNSSYVISDRSGVQNNVDRVSTQKPKGLEVECERQVPVARAISLRDEQAFQDLFAHFLAKE